MNRLDEQYRGLLGEVLYNGVEKEDRTGTGTYSRFGLQIKHLKIQKIKIIRRNFIIKIRRTGIITQDYLVLKHMKSYEFFNNR